jgi:hypothetical protein
MQSRFLLFSCTLFSEGQNTVEIIVFRNSLTAFVWAFFTCMSYHMLITLDLDPYWFHLATTLCPPVPWVDIDMRTP